MDIRYYPLRTNDKVDYVVAVGRDATERKKAEEVRTRLAEEQAARAEAEAARQRINSILESITDAFFALDRQWRFTYVNREAERLLRKKREELLGKNVWEEFPEAVSLAFYPEYHKAMSEQLPVVFEALYPPYEIWVEVRAYPSEEGLLVYFHDITERKWAEQERERLLAEVQRRAAELDATITAIPDGLLIFDEAGEVIRINPAAENATRFSPEELRLPFDERMTLLRPEMADGKPFPIDQLPHERAQRGETVRGTIVAIHPPRIGKTVWQTASAAPIRAPDGRMLGAVLVFTDITALHELQEWLQDLMRTVSHDLRNPLMVIQGQAQLLLRLLDRAGLTGTERRSAEAIVTGAKRMNAMIQDLVESARLESGQLRLEKRSVDLKVFVADLLDRTKGVMDVTRTKVEMPEDLPRVSADPDRLERIFVNLLSNALKYSPPETEVLIGAKRTDAEVTV